MLTQIQLIIEIVLSFFLLMGIIYSFYLGRVLSNLKRDRESLLGLVEKLENSVKSAEEGVDKLRVAGEVSGRPLSRMLEQAKVTEVELDSLSGRADAVADRLQALVTQIPPQEKRLEELIERAKAVPLMVETQLATVLQPDAAKAEQAAQSEARDARQGGGGQSQGRQQDGAGGTGRRAKGRNGVNVRSGGAQQPFENTFLARPIR